MGSHLKVNLCYIFKGGTCLKKYYFGDYRFSQDPDFSVQMATSHI
ncbi:MAG: nucleotidyl transferase AbiEii/AbiGii toxin family protein [Alphaproteobacteria bacterium]